MLKTLRIKTLAILVAAATTTILVVVGGTGVYDASETGRLLRTVSLRDARDETEINRMRLLMETNRSQVLQALQHNPTTVFAKMHDHPVDVHFKIIADTSEELGTRWAKYDAAEHSPEEKKLAGLWHGQSNGLGLVDVKQAGEDIKAARWDEAETVLIKSINPNYKKGDVAFQGLTKFITDRATANNSFVAQSTARNNILMFCVLIAGIMGTIGVGILMIRTLRIQLGGEPAYAKEVVDAIAKGDLTQTITLDSSDRDSLLFNMKRMQSSLLDLVRAIHLGTDTIASASGQIAAGNMELSTRTEQQAATVEETVSSINALTEAVQANAANARQANTLVNNSTEVAKKGGAVVAQVVTTMASINESSRKIVDIIAVIDGIAFQTNILALNAAVEAARAGEQGRGFAVVASEVRNLAQRSATAAKEIKDLIGNSVSKVDVGAKLVNQAGDTMKEIVESVARVTSIMSDITQASASQSEGIAGIHKAMTQVDQDTQQNAALVEEAAAAASSLEDQAKTLLEVASVYQTGDSQRTPAKGLSVRAKVEPTLLT